MRRKNAFTLIELLVVIAVIAMLMSILMPSLSRVKDAAKETICSSNLRQWGVIYHSYVTDNDGSFLEGWRDETLLKYDNDVVDRAIWFGVLRGYYQDPDLRFCPSAVRTRFKLVGGRQEDNNEEGSFTAWGVYANGQWANEGDAGSYGENWWCTNPPADSKAFAGHQVSNHWRKMSLVRTPSSVPLMADCAYWLGRPEPTDPPPPYSGFTTLSNHSGMQRFCVNRHRGYVKILYVDGVADKVALKQLWRQKWHRTFDTSGAFEPIWSLEAPWMVGLPEE